jgi:hypothetical protein
MDHPRSLIDICRLASDSALTDQYLLSYGFGAAPECGDCNKIMYKRKDKVNAFRCGSCNKTTTPKSLFLLSKTHMSKGDILLLGYLWINKVETMKIVEMTLHNPNT